ncbi:MAG: cob(I)yrinic acid a,c-diamide adenosyltransferase [Mucinivorans sp.]
MKVYTKGGDKGRTSLVGGERISKSDPRIEAYGTLDELTAALGYFYDLYVCESPYADQMQIIVSRVMDCAAILATPAGSTSRVRIEQSSTVELETWIDQITPQLPAIESFTLPMGAAAMSYANVCRTICRRAERAVVRVMIDDRASHEAQIYINRLSDYLYVLGRAMAIKSGATEILWRAKLEMAKK